MSDTTAITRLKPRSPLFEIDGRVTQVLRGCGAATVEAGPRDEFSLSRGTDGIHFDQLRVGQRVRCIVGLATNHVLQVHQQTQPITVEQRDAIGKVDVALPD